MAATILFSNLLAQYEVIGPELLLNNSFEQNLEDWEVVGDVQTEFNEVQPSVQLRSGKGRGTVLARQSLENVRKGQKVQFTGMMKVVGVAQGEKAWQAARIIFVAKNANGGPMYNLPHILVAKNGTADWERFSQVFTASSSASGYYVEVQLVDVEGVAWVKNLSLRHVDETLGFRLFKIVGVLIWVATLLWVLLPYRRIIFSSGSNVLIVVVVMGAVTGAILPVDIKHQTVVMLKVLLPWIDAEESVYQVGHLLIYSFLSLFVFWKLNDGRQNMIAFGLLVLLAMATEVLQTMVDGRTPRVSDFAIDLAGIIIGFVISRYIFPHNKMFYRHGMK